MVTATEVQNQIADLQAPQVKLAVTDIDGVLRGKYVTKPKALSALDKGFGFCDVVFGWDCADVLYDNATVTGWHTGYPDTQAQLDPATFRRIPWEQDCPFLLGDLYAKDGTPHAACPRNLLKSVVAKARRMGFEPFAATEFEYFIFNETPHTLHAKAFNDLQPLTPGMFGYSILRSSARSEFLTRLVEHMEAFRCPIEGIHTETGPGVFETALQYAPALESADRAVLFKTAVKELAARESLVATFMAKWNERLPGCSGHIHVSLWSKDGAQNLFDDAAAKHRMSDTFRHFVAGVLTTMPELMACYAPTINSYKRSVPGVWSPLNSTWGVDNRTTALRVIPATDGKATRMEQRLTAADINPYIALAATLAAGLYGIEKRLALSQPPVAGDAYAVPATEVPWLPRTLDAATQKLAASEVARTLLGAGFVDHYVRTRDWEVREYNKAVTDWEKRRYFEII